MRDNQAEAKEEKTGDPIAADHADHTIHRRLKDTGERASGRRCGRSPCVSLLWYGTIPPPRSGLDRQWLTTFRSSRDSFSSPGDAICSSNSSRDLS